MKTNILLPLVTVAALLACGQDNSPAEGEVLNLLGGSAPVTIEKVWFRTTLFQRPIAGGEKSETLRVGTGTEPAYAVVRIGEEKRYLARTKNPISSEAEKKVSIAFDVPNTQSLCFGEPKLTKDEWDFIKSRIFPADEVVDYDDPDACNIAQPPPPDAGVDGGNDGG